MLRAVGPTGHVTGYEIRDDFAQRAVQNVHGFLGADVPLDVEVRDVYDGIDERDLDRIVLDLPEPWRVVKHAVEALRPGGILLAYLPTILQVGRLREELATSPFGMVEIARSAAARLARRGPVDPARSPDGRAHRIPHGHAPPAWTTLTAMNWLTAE